MINLDSFNADKGQPYANWEKVGQEAICFCCSSPIKISVSALPTTMGEEFTYECWCGQVHQFKREDVS